MRHFWATKGDFSGLHLFVLLSDMDKLFGGENNSIKDSQRKIKKINGPMDGDGPTKDHVD
jgi:hypothetical protein